MNPEPGTVLVVDDDFAMRRVLRTILSFYEFGVIEAKSGEEALGFLSTDRCDAVLLDVKLPRLTGVDVCRIVRNRSTHLPIIMLSVIASEDQKVEALDAGADDYVTKPFHTRELVARVRAAIRRDRLREQGRSEITVGEIRLDPARRSVEKRGNPIHLTRKEFELLHHLMSHTGAPIPHTALLKSVWGPEFGDRQEYLRTFIRNLRMKIEDHPASPQYLLTDKHFGYRFKDPLSTE